MLSKDYYDWKSLEETPEVEESVDLQDGFIEGYTEQVCNQVPAETHKQVEASAEQVMAEADELFRLDDYGVDDTVDEEVIIEGKVTAEDSALLQDSFVVSEKSIEELRLNLIVVKEASGSLEERLQLNDDKVFNVANDKKTVEENMLSESKPFQAAAGSDALETAHAEVKLSEVDSKPTKCLEEKLQGK